MVSLHTYPPVKADVTELQIDKRGSDCDGNDGDADRVLTLGNTYKTKNFMVFINGTILHPNHDFTANHLASFSTITFLNQVYDLDYIDGWIGNL